MCLWHLDHKLVGAKQPSAEWSKLPETSIVWHLIIIDPTDWVAIQFFCSYSQHLYIFGKLQFCDIDHGCEQCRSL